MGKRNGNGNGKNGHSKKGAPPPPVTTTMEVLTDEQRQVLFFAHKKKLKELLATVKAAQDALKQAKKIAAEDQVSFKDIKLALDLESDEGEAKAKADVERIARVSRWMGVPLGAQADMFGEDNKRDRHYDDGKRAAMNDELCKPPGHLGQDDSQRWLAGHAAGVEAKNAERARGFKPLGSAPATYMTQ